MLRVLVVSVQKLLAGELRRRACLPPYLAPVAALALLVKPLAPCQHTPAHRLMGTLMHGVIEFLQPPSAEAPDQIKA